MIEKEFGELEELVNSVLDRPAPEVTEQVLTLNEKEARNLVERCTRAFDVFSAARHGAMTNSKFAWEALKDVVGALRDFPRVPAPGATAVRDARAASLPMPVSAEEIIIKSDALDEAAKPIAGLWRISDGGETTFWFNLPAVAAGSGKICLTVDSAGELLLGSLEAAEIEGQNGSVYVKSAGSGWNVVFIGDEIRQYMVGADGMAQEITAERLLDRGLTTFGAYLADLTQSGFYEPSPELDAASTGYDELRMELQRHNEEAREFFADLPARLRSLFQESNQIPLRLGQGAEKYLKEQEEKRWRKEASEPVQSALPGEERNIFRSREEKFNESIPGAPHVADKQVVPLGPEKFLEPPAISPQAGCQKCNSALPEGVKFCVQCGAPVASPERRCPNPQCERPVRAGENFCGECGTRVS